MTVVAFSGPAGSGKTHQLLARLASRLDEHPLPAHAAVLALTYMHGSRRRLEQSLRIVPGLKGKFTCSTFDSLAWMVCRRWRSLLARLSLPLPAENDYEHLCQTAALLIDTEAVSNWISMTYPHLIVDEFQDLTPSRLAMISGLAGVTDCAVATDEFQCLNQELRANPAVNWLRDNATTTLLEQNYRTGDSDLLAAALAVREGRDVQTNARNCKITPAKGVPFAAACVANGLTWRAPWKSVAVLAPSTTGGFATEVISRVASGPIGKAKNGPFAINWEQRSSKESETLRARLRLLPTMDGQQAISLLEAESGYYAVRRTQAWVRKQRSISGNDAFTRTDIEDRLERCITEQARQGTRGSARLTAMTVHQAKNREFDGVVIIWPYTVAGDAEQKRRLLYNAITRARRWCVIVPQSPKLLDAPPFSASSKERRG